MGPVTGVFHGPFEVEVRHRGSRDLGGKECADTADGDWVL